MVSFQKLKVLLSGVTLLNSCLFSSSLLPISYETLMGMKKYSVNRELDDVRAKDKEEIAQLAREYEENIHFMEETPLNHIPKKFHFIWIGPREFPAPSVENVLSWMQYHPGWEVHFWTDSEVRPLPVPQMKRHLVQNYDFQELQQFIDISDNWGEKSDMMRYIILFKEGGVYVDHDIECLRSITRLAESFDLVVGLERPHYHEAIDTCVIPHNALIMSCPDHPILERTIERIVSVWDDIYERHPGQGYMERLHRVIQRTFDSFSISAKMYRNMAGFRDMILPVSYFYPYKTFRRSFIERLQEMGYVYGVHEYTHSWLKKPNKELRRDDGSSWRGKEREKGSEE